MTEGPAASAIELVRAADSDSLRGAIHASTGSHVMIAAADAEFSAEELRQALAASLGGRIEADHPSGGTAS